MRCSAIDSQPFSPLQAGRLLPELSAEPVRHPGLEVRRTAVSMITHLAPSRTVPLSATSTVPKPIEQFGPTTTSRQMVGSAAPKHEQESEVKVASQAFTHSETRPERFVQDGLCARVVLQCLPKPVSPAVRG